MKKKNGFTLVEILIAGVILLMLVGAIGDLFVLHQRSYYKIESSSDAARLAATVLNSLAGRIRAADFVWDGSNPQVGPILFPPPAYPPNPSVLPDATGNYASAIENYVTLSEDPFGANLLTLQFYRPTGRNGGTLYVYKGKRQAPPPTAGIIQGFSSGSTSPIEDIEIWNERGWVVLRISIRDHYGNLVQNSTAAYIRYYN